MTAEEYFRKQLGEYTKSGRYLDKELRFKTSVISEIMEDYHQHRLKLLGIGDGEERTEFPASSIPEFGSDEWIDACEQLFGGIRKK